MNEGQYRLFLSIAAFACAFGAVFNLLKLKSRGSSALILSAAFVVMGFLLWMIRVGAEQYLMTLAGATLAILLVADIVVRSRQRDRRP